MREIKFRAWDKRNNRMYEVVRIDFDRFRNPDNPEFNEIILVETGRATIHLYQPNYILMQFTGLRDKNGKEIYEGDITNLGEVIWRDDGESCGWKLRNLKNRERVYHIGAYTLPLEVTGHIYEPKPTP